MKYTKALIIPLLSLFTISAGTPTPKRAIVFTDIVIGPFDDSQDFYLRFKSGSERTYDGKVELYNAVSGTMYGRSSFTVEEDFGDPVRIFARGRVGTDGLRYVFTFNQTTIAFLINPIVSVELNANAHKRDKVTFNNCCIGIYASRAISSESYDLSDTLDYVTVNENNIVDFSEVCFEYDRSDYLVYSSSYLEVVDYEGVYSFRDQNNIVRFSLTPVVNDGKIYFRQNSQMYVNSNTLEMSPIARVGYQNTNSIYVPIGREIDFENNDLKLVIEDCGFSKSKVVIPLNFFSTSKLFGACHESDYCVEGGIVA